MVRVSRLQLGDTGCRYEMHHGVKITDEALVDAAVESDRYIADRFLPDKAIDLVDEAAAKLKMEISTKPEALDEVDRKVCVSSDRYGSGSASGRWSGRKQAFLPMQTGRV